MPANKIILNGKEENFDNHRLQICLYEVKNCAKRCGKVQPEMLDWNLEIISENNFPTAAGLASSAAGYACLVYALANLYKIEDEEISSIARMGSGSACRSIYGGFVQWKMGMSSNGNDSIAYQICPASHWPDLRIVILVVNDQRKDTSSTSGMSRSVENSQLLKYRAEKCVPEKIESMINAIKTKNFSQFATLTMQDSNQFHAVCLDTFPPCVYMNDVSHKISQFIHTYNVYKEDISAAYTFDAGPNACIYCLKENVQELMALINYTFPSEKQSTIEFMKGIPIDSTYCLSVSYIT